MFHITRRLIGIGLLFLCAASSFAQSSSAGQPAQPCDKSCRQKKLGDLFRALDERSKSDRRRPSQTKECGVFDGREAEDTLMDVCAKLKYVRSIAMGKATNFSCPRDTSSLFGLPAIRIRAVWGEPDFVEGATSLNPLGSENSWTYFIGSPKPGQKGGGFPELSLRFVHGHVGGVGCALSR